MKEGEGPEEVGAPQYRNAAKGIILVGDLPPSMIVKSSGGAAGGAAAPGSTGERMSAQLPSIAVGNCGVVARASVASGTDLKGWK